MIKEETKVEPTSKGRVYHISKRPIDGKWQVKFGGSNKAIKLFDTQQAALAYAKELSENYDRGISIHKRDGKIRKQRY